MSEDVRTSIIYATVIVGLLGLALVLGVFLQLFFPRPVA